MKRFGLHSPLFLSARLSQQCYHAYRCASEEQGKAPTTEQENSEQVITPWEVHAPGPKGIDYDRVLAHFKSELVTPELLQKFSDTAVNFRKKHGLSTTTSGNTSVLSPLLRRGIAFSHRDLSACLDEINAGRQIYLYTGRGPSNASMHIGHILPFLLTAHIQKLFCAPLVIQITDDEKYFFRGIDLKELEKITRENIKDIIAFGIDQQRTFIFRDSTYMGRMYPTVMEIQRLFTANAVKHTFGFNDSDCVGKFAFAAIQAAPSFVSTFPNVIPVKTKNFRCLIPCAIDQDPFFTLTRGVADRLKRPKPSLLHTTFLPALKGPQHKMSSSGDQHGTILLTDQSDVIRKKIRSSFSGGTGTLKDLQEHGANLDVDFGFQLLRHFCESDETVEEVRERYGKGQTNSGAVKELAADVVCKLVEEFKERRESVSPEAVDRVMGERSILFPPSSS